MDEDTRKRRWSVQFGLRDLLWVMVAVGLASGWWVAQNNSAAPQAEVGRYQMFTDQKGRMYIVDTATGLHWAKDSYSGRWHPRERPQDHLAR